MFFSVLLLSIRFDILVFVVLSANLIVGNGDNTNNKCAKYNKSCDPKFHQPCCNQNYTCKFTGLVNEYVCTEKVPLGKHCLTDRHCDVNRHVECSKYGRCVCEPFTLRVDDSTCGPLIGDYCQDNEPCGPKNSVCIHNQCQCETNYFPQSNRICVQKILGMPCVSDTYCAQVKFAKCTERKICECTLNTMTINPYTCGSLINGFCLFDNDCVFVNSYCIDNTCKCKFQHVPSKKPLLDCIPGYLNMTCNSNQSCSDIIDHTICSENRCICKSDYRPINGTSCELTFGGVCANNESCVTINSACIDDECQCKPQYVYQGIKCIPTRLNQVCQSNSDCSKIRNAICSADSKCICDENYEEINKTMCEVKLNSFCSVNGDCLIPNSICISGHCKYRDNYLQVSTKECIATRLEQSCFENRDCKEIMYAKCSEDKKCVCKSNYGKLNETVCAPLLGEFCWNDNLCASSNSECIDNKCQCQMGYLQRSNNECINKYLGKTCINDEDCTEVLHAKCSGAKKCVCRTNYVPSNKTSCTPSLGEFCWKTEKCGPANSICIDNECKCKVNYVQQSNNQCWASNLGQYCNDDTDCKNIKYSKCSKDNTCICKSNYVPLGNKTCKALINESCDNNDDCFLFNVICTNNKCKCLPNFLPQSNKNCLFIYVNIMCKKDEDCKTAKYAKCSEYGICVCNTNHASLNETTCAPRLNEYCQNGSPCATANAICIDNQCQCKSNYRPRFNDYCQPLTLGSSCIIDADCNEVENAICSLDKCVCKKNYIRLNEKTCLPLLGEHCSTDGQCTTQNSDCIDNRCQCKSHFIALSSNECIAAIREKFCHTNSDCIEIRNAECTEKKECSCKLNHTVANKMACEPLLGGFCTTNKDCVTPNSVCNINKCQCDRYYVAKSNNLCEPFTLGRPCENNMMCVQVPNAVCSFNKICVCDKNYYAMDEQTCLPIIGGFCLQDDHCRYNTMHCMNNTCQCKNYFVAISGSQCKESHLVPSCNDNFDCGDPWHGQCSEDEKCVCKENNIALNDWTCSPLIGGLCWIDSQCQVKNSACIDYRCKCKSNFVSVSNNLCVQE